MKICGFNLSLHSAAVLIGDGQLILRVTYIKIKSLDFSLPFPPFPLLLSVIVKIDVYTVVNEKKKKKRKAEKVRYRMKRLKV